MEVENLYLELTRECTLSCEHCLRGEQEHKYMSIETLENTLKDIKKIKTILLSGGEPLLNIKCIEHLPSLLNKYSISVEKIGIITNGTVISKRHIAALKELKKQCKEFEFYLSCDLFHRLEWQRLGVKQLIEENYETYHETLSLKKYLENDCYHRIILQLKGRAKQITKSRLEEIEKNNDIKFDFTTKPLDDSILIYNNKVEGKVCIDVNGNICRLGETFEEEDEKARTDININVQSLDDAIINYRKKVNPKNKIKEKKLTIFE